MLVPMLAPMLAPTLVPVRASVRALVVLMSVNASRSASPEAHPNGRLLRAARTGNVRAIRDVILQTPTTYLDLDAALSVAASRSQLNAMSMLVDMGAADLNRALVSASRWNHCRAIRWLTDEKRIVPADAYDLAREAASAMASCDAEWLLVSLERYEERKRRRAEWDL